MYKKRSHKYYVDPTSGPMSDIASVSVGQRESQQDHYTILRDTNIYIM